MVFDDIVVTVYLRAHHHDGQVDARTAQLHAFVGKSHRQVVDIMELKHIGHLKVTAAIAEGFHHHHEFGFGLDLRPEMVKVVDQVVEVDLKHGLMRLLLQFHADLLKLERTRTFQQDGLVAELREGEMRQKVAHVGEEIAFHVELVGLARNAFTDTDQHVNVFVLQQLGNLRI